MSGVRLPKTSFKAKYPFNYVETSESGHQKEVDDTPGAERLRESHKSGTYWEISADGRKVELIVTDSYEYIKGGLTLTVDNNGDVKIGGNLRVVIVGDAYLEIGGDTHQIIKGNVTQAVKGNMDQIIGGSTQILSKGDMELHSDGDLKLTAKGDVKLTADGDVRIKGSDIHESPPDPHGG